MAAGPRPPAVRLVARARPVLISKEAEPSLAATLARLQLTPRVAASCFTPNPRRSQYARPHIRPLHSCRCGCTDRRAAPRCRAAPPRVPAGNWPLTSWRSDWRRPRWRRGSRPGPRGTALTWAQTTAAPTHHPPARQPSPPPTAHANVSQPAPFAADGAIRGKHPARREQQGRAVATKERAGEGGERAGGMLRGRRGAEARLGVLDGLQVVVELVDERHRGRDVQIRNHVLPAPPPPRRYHRIKRRQLLLFFLESDQFCSARPTTPHRAHN